MRNILSKLEVKEKLEKIVWQGQFGFECYDTKISFRTDGADLETKLKSILPVFNQEICFEESSDILSLVVCENNDINGLYFNNELAMVFEEFDESLLEFIEDKILTILALTSLPTKFYVHAGAVAWDGFGIIMPGKSFAGKTTLVKEFIKSGAEYFSDDCVILDNEGYLLPFPRSLVIRTEGGRVLIKPDDFGAKNATDKVKLKLILLTNYEKGAVWQPKIISQAQGVLELMNNFYYKSSVGAAPKEIIKSLTKITQNAFIIGGKRDEANLIVEWFLHNFQEKI